jgi:hypothetical protein
LVVLLAAAVAVLARHQPGLVFLVAAAAVGWLVTAWLRAKETVTVSADRVTWRGSFGGKELSRTAAASARYFPVYAQGRALLFCVLQLTATDGQSLWIGRYGWRPGGDQLFAALAAWLSQTSARVDERTRAALH